MGLTHGEPCEMWYANPCTDINMVHGYLVWAAVEVFNATEACRMTYGDRFTLFAYRRVVDHQWIDQARIMDRSLDIFGAVCAGRPSPHPSPTLHSGEFEPSMIDV